MLKWNESNIEETTTLFGKHQLRINNSICRQLCALFPTTKPHQPAANKTTCQYRCGVRSEEGGNNWECISASLGRRGRGCRPWTALVHKVLRLAGDHECGTRGLRKRPKQVAVKFGSSPKSTTALEWDPNDQGIAWIVLFSLEILFIALLLAFAWISRFSN